jgi:hypothetical protein
VRALASTIGLTTADSTWFFGLATRMEKQLAALDKETAPLIGTAKKKRAAEDLIPPAPSSLAELENRRWQIVRNGITSIGSQIGGTARPR